MTTDRTPAELRELAEAAKGGWLSGEWHPRVEPDEGPEYESDRAFVRAMSPDVTLSLLTQLAEEQAKVAALSRVLEEIAGDEFSRPQSRVARLMSEKAADALDDLQAVAKAHDLAEQAKGVPSVELIAEALRVVVGSDYFDGMETHPFAPVAPEEEK